MLAIYTYTLNEFIIIMYDGSCLNVHSILVNQLKLPAINNDNAYH